MKNIQMDIVRLLCSMPCKSMARAGVEVREAGRALRVQTEVPHLVSMGSGRLSTAVTLHPLPEGKITLGSNGDADISICGTGVEPVHCTIENDNGVVTLHPVNGKTAVDGVPINSPIRLTQGCMLSIGRSNYMRFNNPAEAKRLRSALPHSRISVSPMSLSTANVDQPCQESPRYLLERKPPVAPRKSPRNSCSDDEGSFFGKLSKFEMLARQNRANCVSPKVFPAGGITTNVPADQILGHSRSSSLVSLTNNNTGNNNNNCHHGSSSSGGNINHNDNSALRNLTNLERSRSNTPMDLIASSPMLEGQCQRVDGAINSDKKTSSVSNVPKTHRLARQMHLSTENLHCHENGNNENGTNDSYEWGKNAGDIMSRSLTCQRTYDLLGTVETREYDMSQSLTLGSNTTALDYQSTEKFLSIPCVRPLPKRIQPPSPAFNREPKYCNEDKANEIRAVTPTQSMSSGCSLDELRGRLHVDAETKRKRAQEERLREQELERQEKLRLEEILAMCAEYERQTKVDKPRKPIGIKTNGSLPREKRIVGGHALQLEEIRNSPKNHTYFTFDTVKRCSSSNTASYENVSMESSLIILPTDGNGSYADNEESSGEQTQNRCRLVSPDSSMESDVLASEECLFSSTLISTSRSARGPNKENSKLMKSKQPIETESDRNSSSFGLYENIPKVPCKHDRNNDRTRATSQKAHRTSTNSHETIDNKLAISNDDLLEAIEQLSMLSKSREIRATPKRNNSECDNTKSNEAKADKEKKELERQAREKYIEFLQNEKLHVLSNMDSLKRSVTDIETQEEEISRELELEKALLSAEYESESLKLNQDEGEKLRVQMRINELEREMNENNATQANLQAEAKQRVQNAQRICSSLEEDLSTASDEFTRQEITKKLLAQQDVLESERKSFEDLEFRHLEEEASKLATREELQRYLSELTARIESRKSRLSHLELQRNEARKTASKDAKSLERQKLNHLKKLEEGRNRLRGINDELGDLTQNPTENSEEKRSPSREDFDRISRVTNDSPIVNERGSLGKKTIESLKEIERNRQLHLAKQGSQVISEERRRVEELKRRVQDEVRSQWEERKMNCASFNSIESGEESSSYSTGPTESGSGSSDGAEGANNLKLSPNKLSEVAPSSPGPSNGPYGLSENDHLRDAGRTSIESERQLFGNKSCSTTEDNNSRPLSQTSSEMDTLAPLQPVKHREKTKLQRPLTRYLPIKSESLDLRHHIETAGHQLPLIYDVTVDATSCSGYLSKMSKKFHHWNKRWFVFDRKKKTLSYYSDNTSRKARGIVYFQCIEEVYVDHMNTVRSPQPSLTFIVKTTTRLYHLMAPSPEAMRVWVDVVFTGAEGYHEFEHDF